MAGKRRDRDEDDERHGVLVHEICRATSPPCPCPGCNLISRYSLSEVGPYSKVHKKQRRAAILQDREVVRSQHESLSANTRERNAQEFARLRLRSSSVLQSERVNYDEKLLLSDTFQHSFYQYRPMQGPERDAYDSRLCALKDRISTSHPYRYEAELWDKFRLESVSILTEYYPKSTFTSYIALG